MNKEILVEIWVPAAGESYDVYIPLESRLYEILGVLSGLISSLTEGTYKAMGDALLYSRETGEVYDENQTVEELGIQNGSCLILL